jgi:hypothetical protein
MLYTMIISIVSLLLLAVAAYFLIRTKPNIFLFELMKEAFGEEKGRHHSEYTDKPQSEEIRTVNTSQQNKSCTNILREK